MSTMDLTGTAGCDHQATHTSFHGLSSDGSLWFLRTWDLWVLLGLGSRATDPNHSAGSILGIYRALSYDCKPLFTINSPLLLVTRGACKLP